MGAREVWATPRRAGKIVEARHLTGPGTAVNREPGLDPIAPAQPTGLAPAGTPPDAACLREGAAAFPVPHARKRVTELPPFVRVMLKPTDLSWAGPRGARPRGVRRHRHGSSSTARPGLHRARPPVDRRGDGPALIRGGAPARRPRWTGDGRQARAPNRPASSSGAEDDHPIQAGLRHGPPPRPSPAPPARRRFGVSPFAFKTSGDKNLRCLARPRSRPRPRRPGGQARHHHRRARRPHAAGPAGAGRRLRPAGIHQADLGLCEIRRLARRRVQNGPEEDGPTMARCSSQIEATYATPREIVAGHLGHGI